MLHAVSSRSVAAAARSSTTRQLAAGRPAARRLSRARVATVEAKTKEEKKAKKEEEEEYTFDGPDVSPSTQQVQEFLSTLCDETEIAEIELKMGNFALKVRRDVEGAAAAPAPAAPSPVADMGVRAPLPAMAAAAPASGYASVDGSELSSDEGSARADSSDESAVYVVSPKVGIFRRGKYAAGKRIGKALCVEGVGATLKRGQTVGYVEQLGTYVPVDAPQAGEVLSILDEGAPVEYQQEVVKLAPFFGGHIIGEAKYA